MTLTLKTTSGKPLCGEISLPGDKSISHRAILFSALADGKSVLENLLVAGVTEAMLTALSQLGVDWTLDGTKLEVDAKGLSGVQPPILPINCGNSATTMRLLVGVLAAVGAAAVLDGSESLRRRPMARVVDPLWEMGAAVRALGEGGTAPLQIAARFGDRLLRSLVHNSPVASAQVKSCLLLAALAADGEVIFREPAPSRDHTERLLTAMGADLERIEHPSGSVQVVLRPRPEKNLAPLHLTIPGDISSAAFLIVAAIITPGSQLTIRDVGLNPTRTGLLDALKAMGANLSIERREERHGEPVGDLVVSHSELRGIEIASPLVVRMIDEFPVFAVAAAHAQGETVVRDCEELRYKETDRITNLCVALQSLGVNITEADDGFRVQGGTPLTGGEVIPYGDHRLAMALAVAGLNAQSSVTVQNAGIISESFPSFFEVLSDLGANVSYYR